MERNLCEKCGACCKNIAVDFQRLIIYRDGIQLLNDRFKEMLIPTEEKEGVTLCTCKFLKNNCCTNINKPEECKNYPFSPFAFLPEGCGYYGEIFNKKEFVKQKIRRLKEDIIEYSTQLKSDKSLQRIIDRHQKTIDKYKAYGSEDW